MLNPCCACAHGVKAVGDVLHHAVALGCLTDSITIDVLVAPKRSTDLWMLFLYFLTLDINVDAVTSLRTVDDGGNTHDWSYNSSTVYCSVIATQDSYIQCVCIGISSRLSSHGGGDDRVS